MSFIGVYSFIAGRFYPAFAGYRQFYGQDRAFDRLEQRQFAPGGAHLSEWTVLEELVGALADICVPVDDSIAVIGHFVPPNLRDARIIPPEFGKFAGISGGRWRT